MPKRMAEGKPLTMSIREDNVDEVRIKRGKVDSLSLYEVTEAELQELETGGQDNLLLNFAVFLISTATSFFISLLTTEIKSVKTFCVFVIVTIVGFVVGTLLMILWIRTRKSKASIINRIKDRMPKENPTDMNARQSDAVAKE